MQTYEETNLKELNYAIQSLWSITAVLPEVWKTWIIKITYKGKWWVEEYSRNLMEPFNIDFKEMKFILMNIGSNLQNEKANKYFDQIFVQKFVEQTPVWNSLSALDLLTDHMPAYYNKAVSMYQNAWKYKQFWVSKQMAKNAVIDVLFLISFFSAIWARIAPQKKKVYEAFKEGETWLVW